MQDAAPPPSEVTDLLTQLAHCHVGRMRGTGDDAVAQCLCFLDEPRADFTSAASQTSGEIEAFLTGTTAAVLAGLVTLGLVTLVLSETTFLASDKPGLLARHLWHLVGVLGVVFLNLVAAASFVGRVLCLKDTGRKLAHLEKPTDRGTGDAIVQDLGARLGEEDEA
jgi:hypothetical protein